MTELVGHVAEMALVQVRRAPGEDFERVVRSLKLTPSFGPIWYTGLDLGTPSPDVDSTRIPNDNGEDDRTAYFGARAVAINLMVSDDWFPKTGTELWDQRQNSSSYWVKELGRWTRSGFRSWLYIRFTGDSAVYRMALSGRGQSAPISSDGVNHAIRALQVNFSCPTGILQEFAEDTDHDRATRDGRLRYVFGFFDDSDHGVLINSFTFPMTFPSVTLGNDSGIDYDGTVGTGAIFRIYASGEDFANPSLELTPSDVIANGGDGAVIEIPGATYRLGFQGFTIPAGEFVEINTETKTVLANADPATPIDKWLVGPLRWLRLEPGRNLLKLTQNLNADGSTPAAPSAFCSAECLYYPAST